MSLSHWSAHPFLAIPGEYGARQRTLLHQSLAAGDLIETVRAERAAHDISIHAGETSWEGEGFMAVVTVSTGQLLWLLHLSTSEPFVEVATDGQIIRAVSGGYPPAFRWSIPICAPETFTVG